MVINCKNVGGMVFEFIKIIFYISKKCFNFIFKRVKKFWCSNIGCSNMYDYFFYIMFIIIMYY